MAQNFAADQIGIKYLLKHVFIATWLVCIFYLLCFRKDTSILELVDIGMLCAMGPPGGGRNSVTQRFVRHFNVISMLSFDEQTMKNIFSPIMDWHFNSFETNHRRWSRVRITVVIPLWQFGFCHLFPCYGNFLIMFNFFI